MQTGTRQPHVPPRLKFRPVSPVSACFGLFQPSASTAPPATSVPPASAFKPSTSYKAASKLSTSLQAFNQLQPSSFACKFLVSPFQICGAVAVAALAALIWVFFLLPTVSELIFYWISISTHLPNRPSK
uniref:Uncharacterized protein n=1 Tax=Fagus sylvatica TaxID=28930 RepID=A0A2N9ERG5_FAGSY